MVIIVFLLVVLSPSSHKHKYRGLSYIPIIRFHFRGISFFLNRWPNHSVWTIWLRINHTSQTQKTQAMSLSTKKRSKEEQTFMSINFNVILFCWPQPMNRSCWDNSNVMYNSHSDGFYMARTGNRSYRFNSNNNKNPNTIDLCSSVIFYVFVVQTNIFQFHSLARRKRSTWIKRTKTQIKWEKTRKSDHSIWTDIDYWRWKCFFFFFGNSSKHTKKRHATRKKRRKAK